MTTKTPETDLVHSLINKEFRDILTQYHSMLEHARKLERERDELKKKLLPHCS